MQTFKPSEPDLTTLRGAAARLKKANALFGVARRESDAAKKLLSDWLKKNRQVDIETLPIGDIVCMEDVALIEISKQNKFDQDGFLAAEPETHARWKKDFPVLKYKPLV